MRVVDAGKIEREPIAARIVDVGNVVRQVKRIQALDADGTTWRVVATFASAMTASITPPSSGATAPSATITSPAITCAISGGLGPYTYAWVEEEYEYATPNFGSETLATTTVIQTGVPSKTSTTSVVRCTVTDALGNTASATCSITFTNIS